MSERRTAAWGAPMHVRAKRMGSSLVSALLVGAMLASPTLVAAQSGQATPPAAGTTSRTEARPESRPAPRLVSIAFVGVALEEALARLATLSGMNLVWGSEILQAASSADPDRSRISCRFNEAPAERVLDCITTAAGLDWYRLSSGTYVVTARAERAPAYASLSGLVLDATTGDPIPAARIRLAEVAAPREALSTGLFAFGRLAPGTYAVSVQAIGYRPWRGEITLAPSAARRERITLERVSTPVAPVVINGLRLGASSAALAERTFTDGSALPLVQPMTFFLPGAPEVLGVSRRDGSGDLHIQGGEVGEHQWRLDGVPLYDAAALSGLFGVVAPAALERIAVRRAGFRAGAGSYSAGVIDLEHTPGEADARSPQAALTADPLAVQGRLTVPFARGGARVRAMLVWREGLWDTRAPLALTRAFREWNRPDAVLMHRLSALAGLPTHPDAAAAAFATQAFTTDVGLRNVHAAVRVDLPNLQRIEFSTFVSRNALGVDAHLHDANVGGAGSHDAYRWTTEAAQVRHRMLLGARITQSIQLRAVQQTLAHDAWVAMDSGALGGVGAAMMGDEGNRLRDLAVAAEWSFAGSSRWEAEWGAEVARVMGRLRSSSAVLRPIATESTVGRATVWGDVTRRVGASLWLESGLRVTRLGTGRVYAEPRVALRREGFTERLGAYTWRLAAGGYHQFVNQFDIATTMPVALVPSLRSWLPTDGVSGVPTSWHAVAEGVLRPGASWEVRGEVYGKWQPLLLAFDYGALLTGTGPLTATDFIRRARGHAAGVGVRVDRLVTVFARAGRLGVSYDGGIARRTFPSRFGGARQMTPWLEPHRAQAFIEFEPTSALRVSWRARGVWGRGWALRQSFYDLLGPAGAAAGLPLDDPERMTKPALVEADVGATWTRLLAGARVEVGVSAQNLLDRRNVLDYGLRSDVASGTYRMVPRYLPGRQLAVTLRIAP